MKNVSLTALSKPVTKSAFFPVRVNAPCSVHTGFRDSPLTDLPMLEVLKKVGSCAWAYSLTRLFACREGPPQAITLNPQIAHASPSYQHVASACRRAHADFKM